MMNLGKYQVVVEELASSVDTYLFVKGGCICKVKPEKIHSWECKSLNEPLKRYQDFIKKYTIEEDQEEGSDDDK